MLSGLMKKMAMSQEDDKEMESPEEASLSDLIGMLEDVIAKKGMSKKKPVQMSLEIEAGEPKEGEGILAEKAEDEDELKSKLFG